MSLLKSSGLFVVNQDDTNYAISTDVLKEYIAPLAKQELGDPYDPGQPGLIMPGDGFIYDETTGLLEINIPSGLVYAGLIGSNQTNGEVLEPDPYGEVPGHFYIVAEEVTLCNDVWPGITKDPSDCVDVNINDKIIMNNDEEWDIIPAITEDFIHVGPTPPNDPDEGNLWWETESENDQLYIWVLDVYGNGEWKEVSTGGATVSDSPPGEPSLGDLWVDTDQWLLYVYDGHNWVGLTNDGGVVGGGDEVTIPFVNSYKLVSPDDFTGEHGTAALETDAYAGGSDSYLSPVVQIARFASVDLNGKKHEAVNIDESFELSSTEVANEYSRPYIYGKFKVTGRLNFSEYSVDFDSSRAFRFVEGDTIYYRPSAIGDYVKKKGSDTMEGPLTVTGGRNVDPVTGVQSLVKVLNVDSGGSSSLNLKHNGNTKIYVGDQQSSFAQNIKFTQEDKYVYAGDDTDKKGLAFNSDGVQYFGDYTENEHVATKLNVEEAIYHDVLDPDTNKYVDRTGDVMDGDLILEESRLVFRNPVGNQTLIRANRDVGAYPVILDLVNNSAGTATSGGYDIKIGGSTAYNSLRFIGQGTYMEIYGGGGAPHNIKFYTDISLENNKIAKLAEPTDETDAANKKYVDDRDELLRQDIIELEEEIDAIAPSVEYGTWEWKAPPFNNTASAPEPGTFFLLDISSFPTISYTEEYGSTSRIKIHNQEYVPDGSSDPVNTHFWTNATPGKLIQLYDAADPDFLLGEIIATDTSNPDYVYIDVDLIQTSGVPNDNPDLATGKYLTRINIFEKPIGGTASEFVKKSGDTMTSDLTIDRSTGTADVAAALVLKGERPNTTNSAATIKFENAKNSSNPGNLTYKSSGSSNWFDFDQDVDLNNHGLHSVKQIRMQHGAYIGVGQLERIKIRDPSNNNDGNASVSIERPSNGRRGFAIRGTNKADNEIDILWSYTNSSDIDAINYDGKMINDNNLVNKGYVDDKFDFSQYPELT